MKVLMAFLTIVASGAFFIYASPYNENSHLEKQGCEWFKKEAPSFIKSAQQLGKSLEQLKEDDIVSLVNAKKALFNCRVQYKKISYLLEYYFPYEATICNGTPAQDPEEDEQITPSGLQVIEAWLFSPNPTKNREASIEQTQLMEKTVEKVLPLVNDLKTNDASFLQSIDMELVRIMTLYLTSFDAPYLKSGVSESYQSFCALEAASLPFCQNEMQKDSMQYFFSKGKEFFKTGMDFDSFDRLQFLTRYALPIQKTLHELIRSAKGQPSIFTAININADNLFQPEGLSKDAFPNSNTKTNAALINLGRQLFHEKALSINSQRSCASCHRPDSYFMDDLARNHTLNGTDSLPRNTPTLLYADMQYMQFWDGRVSSIEQQVNAVLKNDVEMGATEELIVHRLTKKKDYADKFREIWSADPQVSMAHVASALAAYVRSLTPFTSAFDQYISGDDNALSPSAKNGFNIFMGKAGCGKCHFAPVFNGLMPPFYTTTEFEVTGTPVNSDFAKPLMDSDMGRYHIVPVESYRRAFKTPTVRDAAVTAPYMHNGVLPTLTSLIDFYDKGGGAGIGLNVPEQTLLPSPLNLTNEEKSELTAFIESLTDKQIKK